MKFLCRATDHELSRRVLEAFAEGTPGALFCHTTCLLWPDEIPVYYGILRGCGDEMKDHLKNGRPFVYIDHGYFGDKDNVNLTGHYRIIVNGLHHKIPRFPEPSTKVDLPEIAPWRPTSMKQPLILVPPSEAVADFYGIDRWVWVDRERCEFVNTVVSTKADNNLDELLKDCRGLHTHSSTAAVKALMLGISARCTAERAPAPPHRTYGRHDLLGWLAERQFTLGEIRDGRHLEHLRREVEGEGKRPSGEPSPGGGYRHEPEVPRATPVA